MLFHFTLDNIADIEPWGASSKLSLNWFGLSAGTYHIKAGSDELLRYSDEAIKSLAEKAETPGLIPYVDYYIARLYEDIMTMLPATLEPVPDFLIKYLKMDTGRHSWYQVCDDWLSGYLDREEDSEAIWNTFYTATTWIENRALDTGYLSPSANIHIWSDSKTVTLQWRNEGKTINEKPAWSAKNWQFTLSREQYIHEVKDFHRRFMGAMAKQVTDATENWPHDDVAIDFKALTTEQSMRAKEIPNEILLTEISSDWEDIYKAIEEIEKDI